MNIGNIQKLFWIIKIKMTEINIIINEKGKIKVNQEGGKDE